MNTKEIFYNSQDLDFKKPFGAIPYNERVEISILTLSDSNIENLSLKIFQEDKESLNLILYKEIFCKKIGYIDFESKRWCKWGASFDTPKSSHLFYHFQYKKREQIFFYGNNQTLLGGIGESYLQSPKNYQITLYDKEYSIPNWFKKSIGYQIFPDRFFNGNDDGKINSPKSNSFIYGDWYDTPMYIKNNNLIARWDFFGGNLKGIEKKIDYFKSLNIDFIYLNPIFEATSNHRYDTNNYHKIDPILGNLQDFESLINKFSKENINFILDGVFNHTGKNSIYFKSAIKSKNSPFYPWYKFIQYPDRYHSWWGIDDLPNVNELCSTYLEYIINSKNSVLSYWFSKGIMGWRLDVADELPSYFIESFKYRSKEINKDSILIGEVWEDASNKVSYNQRREYFNGLQLDSVMNYPFREYLLQFLSHTIDTALFTKYFYSLKENYPKENFYSLFNLLGTHDTPRIRTILNNILTINNIDKKFLNNLEFLAISILFFIPGVPVIYYGDEVGVEGDKDPDNRRTFPWGKENLDILDFYKEIIKIRKKYPNFFEKEDCEFIPLDNYIFIIKRGNLQLIINADHSKNFIFECKNIQYSIYKNSKFEKLSSDSIDISPLNFIILLKK